MKICNKCGVEKEDTEFRKPRNGCIACEKAADKVRHSVPGHLEAVAAKNRERRKDPGYRAAEAEARRERRKDPGYRAAEAEAQRERLKDPEVRAAYYEAARKVKCKRRNFFNLLKMERPCYDCGGMFPPEVTDWDHLPGKVKSFNLSTHHDHPIEEVIDEINKCQLVCANCHRVRTQARKQKKI